MSSGKTKIHKHLKKKKPDAGDYYRGESSDFPHFSMCLPFYDLRNQFPWKASFVKIRRNNVSSVFMQEIKFLVYQVGFGG